ncbi:hypothetical protein [Spongiimicrobium salis]|uniref:hypothetical protein n=1 Tax=Spongiimicrobium salis TaxID=1667022 RepID=UPI00374D9D2F
MKKTTDKLKDRNKPRSYARIGFIDIYLEIAIDACVQYLKDKHEHDVIVAEGGELHEGFMVYDRMEEYLACGDRMTKEVIKTLTFLATFLESYINDLSGIVLGDQYSRKHLDKLDLVSKWMIIPRLITGKELDKSKSYYGKLKQLVSWRNQLVHPKSSNLSNHLKSLNTPTFKPIRAIYEIVDVLDVFAMLEDLFQDLDRIDKNGGHTYRIKSGIARIRRQRALHSKEGTQ